MDIYKKTTKMGEKYLFMSLFGSVSNCDNLS